MSAIFRALALAIIGCVLASGVRADESRPAYLQITLQETDRVSMLFKVPAIGDRRFGLYPALPANCVAIDPPVAWFADNAYTERASFQCDGGIRRMVVRRLGRKRHGSGASSAGSSGASSSSMTTPSFDRSASAASCHSAAMRVHRCSPTDGTTTTIQSCRRPTM